MPVRRQSFGAGTLGVGAKDARGGVQSARTGLVGKNVQGNAMQSNVMVTSQRMMTHVVPGMTPAVRVRNLSVTAKRQRTQRIC